MGADPALSRHRRRGGLLLLGVLCCLSPGAAGNREVPVRRLPPLSPAEKVGARLALSCDSLPPDQVITVLADLSVQVDLNGLGARMTAARLSREERAATVRAALRETAEREQAALARELQAWQAQGAIRSWRGARIVNRLILEARVDAVPALAASPAIARLQEGWRVRTFNQAPRPVSLGTGRRASRRAGSENWALDVLGVPALWKQRRNGRGVVVGSLDSGVDGTHPQLTRNRRPTDSWFDPAEGRPEPWDSHEHGTGTLGCAVGQNREGRRIGVAPRATWVAALANLRGRFHPTHFTEAADWMLFTGRPDVLLMAFGFEPGTCRDDLRPFLDAFRAAEIFCVFPAGNDGAEPGTDIPPANYTGLYPGNGVAFAVGGLERDRRQHPKSGTGPNSCGDAVYPTVVAPAGGLPAAMASPQKRYDWREGTSFAAGYAAGVVALCYQRRPDILIAELEAVLTATARDLGPPGPDDRYGYGLLDPAAALRRLDRRRAR